MANTNSYATAGTALNMASPMLNMVPYVGPLLSMGAGIAGGMLEKKAAQEQAAQAKKTRDEALGLKPDPVNQYFIQKYRADKAAALGGMPGYELAKNAIDTNIATGIRTGMESGASGAQRLALASALVGKGNQSLNQLAMQNASITGGLQEAARNDLGMLGTQANRQQDIRDKWKQYGLTGAAELEKSATYNNVNALNKIMGSVASTATALGASAKDEKNNAALIAALGASGFGSGNNAAQVPATDTATSDSPAVQSSETIDFSQIPYDGNQLTADQAAILTSKLNQMLIDPTSNQSEIAALRNILKQYSTKTQ